MIRRFSILPLAVALTIPWRLLGEEVKMSDAKGNLVAEPGFRVMTAWQAKHTKGFVDVGAVRSADGVYVYGLGVLKTPRKKERSIVSQSVQLDSGKRHLLSFTYKTGYGLEYRGYQEIFVSLDDWVVWRADLAVPDKARQASLLFDVPAERMTLTFGKRGLKDEGGGWAFQSTISNVLLRPAVKGDKGDFVTRGKTVIVPVPKPPARHVFGNETEFRLRMACISDRDLFAALDLDRPPLADVRAAVDAADYAAAYRAWATYWDAKDKVILIAHNRGLQPMADVEAAFRADPDRVAQAERNAAPVMRHKIKGWGNVTHQHGEIVDFNFNYGCSGKYGFHYWGWSGPLLTAYHATGEAKYLAEFDRLFNQWYEQRDAVKGAIRSLNVIWYELGLGLRNRQFLHYYTCPYADRSAETHERMLKTALGAARWLHRLQRRGYRGGNWQIMGSYGLVDIAVRLPEFREAPSWVAVGVQRLAEHVERDFHADGCHSERVPTSYMGIAYRDPRDLMALLRAAGVENESVQRFGARLEKVLEWWMLATNPLGGLPALNDGSSRRLPEAALREGAALYERPDFLYVADRLGGGVEETAGKPPAVTSVHLAPSRVVALRSGWQRDDNYLFLNYGTHSGGHTHRAMLDFELFGGGAPLALDAGIGLTYDDPLHGRWYTTARAHNMLVVDEANVDKRAARGRDMLWHSDARLDVFAATHEGYRKSHGLTHRRSVAFLKPDVFVVFDSCAAERQGQTLSWYFHSPTDLMVGDAGRVVSAAGPGVLLMEAWPDRLSGVREGKGMCSLSQFGGYREIDWIAYDRATGPGDDNRFGVLMLPFADAPPEVEFSALPSPPDTAALQLVRGAVTDFLIFGNGKRLALLDGRLVTDGAFAWIRRDAKGQRYGTLVQGKTLTWDGHDIPGP